MRIADDLEVSYAQIARPAAEPKLGLFDKLERWKLLIIVVAVALGFVPALIDWMLRALRRMRPIKYLQAARMSVVISPRTQNIRWS